MKTFLTHKETEVRKVVLTEEEKEILQKAMDLINDEITDNLESYDCFTDEDIEWNLDNVVQALASIIDTKYLYSKNINEYEEENGELVWTNYDDDDD